MQQALQIQTRVDQEIIRAIPALTPLLGHRVQVIALDLEPPVVDETRHKVSFQQFLSQRLRRPEGVAPVTLEDMDAAIVRGYLDANI